MIKYLQFNETLQANYHSNSQKIRVLSESWMIDNSYCPCCGKNLCHYQNNKPVADFYCNSCQEDFELKSKQNTLGIKITDGAYNTMIERLASDKNPHFFFMTYQNHEVKDLVLVPKHFFTESLIEKRKPLADNARRAGWIGCNILLSQVPESGKIFYIKNRNIIKPDEVLTAFQKTLFLRNKNNDLKGWLLDVMKCIDKLQKKTFYLDDIYRFENVLQQKHPNNNFIKDKIRQQLQYLRDKGYLEFKGGGKYELI